MPTPERSALGRAAHTSCARADLRASPSDEKRDPSPPGIAGAGVDVSFCDAVTLTLRRSMPMKLVTDDAALPEASGFAGSAAPGASGDAVTGSTGASPPAKAAAGAATDAAGVGAGSGVGGGGGLRTKKPRARPEDCGGGGRGGAAGPRGVVTDDATDAGPAELSPRVPTDAAVAYELSDAWDASGGASGSGAGLPSPLASISGASPLLAAAFAPSLTPASSADVAAGVVLAEGWEAEGLRTKLSAVSYSRCERERCTATPHAQHSVHCRTSAAGERRWLRLLTKAR